jgi:hypothetical protein
MMIHFHAASIANHAVLAARRLQRVMDECLTVFVVNALLASFEVQSRVYEVQNFSFGFGWSVP